MTSSTPTMPKSIAHWSDPFVITVLITAVYVALYKTTLDNLQLSLAINLVLTIYMVGTELWRAPWRKTPRPIVPFKDVLTSASLKWVGSMSGLCVMLFGWWLLREYDRPQYGALMHGTLPYALPYVPVVVFLTHLFTEWRLGPSDGDGKDLGLFTLLQWSKVDGRGVRDELLTWFIKGFFFSINFCELPNTLRMLRGHEEEIMALPWPQMQGMLIMVIYAYIIASIIPGYMFSARIINTHVRRIAHTWFAYTVTLVCYSPFVMGMANRWFDYHAKAKPFWNKPWVVHFSDYEIMLYILGIAMLCFEVVHYWGEAIFGVRSSNLCNRGIITAGPYRYCKHPVYAAKCATWLLMWLPFMSGDTVLECVRMTCAWFCVCVVFGARSWAEERILAEDPDYVAYALWVDQNGLFAPVSKYIPLLQFRWRLKRWIKRGEVSADVVPAGYVL